MTKVRLVSRALSALVVLFSLPAALAAQGTGRIIGRVVDAQSGAPIAGATVEVTGGALRTTTAADGRYTILNVAAGTVSLTARMIGFQAKTVTGLVVREGGATAQDIALSSQVVQFEEIAVGADLEKGSVSKALDEQRNSAQVVNAITAEQISKSPDSDAGQAIQRVSGVTVQDGKFVFVRGLGERYTTTSVNGSRLASPEPEKKVVPLDLFPAGLLEEVSTTKSFTPDQPGDFAGASVNLKTREFPAKRTFSFGVSMGYNSRATGEATPRAPTVGTEWRGLPGDERKLPAEAEAAGFLVEQTQEQRIPIINSFRNVWNSSIDTPAPNGSVNAYLGGEDPVFGQLIGYTASFSYSTANEVRAEEERAAPFPAGGGFTTQVNRVLGSTGRQAVLWGGLLNLSTRIGANTKLYVNNSYTRGGDNEALDVQGFYEQFQLPLEVTRLTMTSRSVYSGQLGAEHLLGQRHIVDWQGGYNAVRRDEPDRSDLVYTGTGSLADGSFQPTTWFGAIRSATRTFTLIDENAYDGQLNYKLLLGNLGAPFVVKAGGYLRGVDRDSDQRQYDIYTGTLTDAQRSRPATEIFDGTYANQGDLLLTANASAQYAATERLYAGYAMVDFPLGRRIRVIGGARVESAKIDVNTTIVEGATPRPVLAQLDNTDILPSLAVTIGLAETHQLRLSAGRTLSRPEYRELSPGNYFDILGGQRVFGNPNLVRATIQNYDARWEWYPRPGEVITIGGFYKRFTNPIERILIQNADGFTPDVSFTNAEGATNIGAEVEFRKRLDFVGSWASGFTFFANGTLMRSRITLPDTGLASQTNPERPMTGQSPYVVNAGLGYVSPGGISATVLYNVAGRRIAEAGITPFPDAYEEPRNFLDLSVSAPIMRALSVKLDARNLLDTPFRITQGTTPAGVDVVRLRYLQGRVFQVGFRWTPTAD